ncbi:MAG: GNAT family acetyltransferase [Candidatus Latescibacterota bacterium]|nr:MAG: GNAT family acetyltransferase [Candidatus Latescibacterota bacterium]
MSSQDLIIRPYLEEDSVEVIALWREVFTNDPPWNDPPQVIQRKLAVQRELFLIGELRGRIVATVIAGYDGFRGWIYHLAVAPNEQRKGLGRAMMAEAEKRLKAIGCPKINLQVRSTNTDVIAFYKALGYSVEDHTSFGKLLD